METDVAFDAVGPLMFWLLNYFRSPPPSPSALSRGNTYFRNGTYLTLHCQCQVKKIEHTTNDATTSRSESKFCKSDPALTVVRSRDPALNDSEFDRMMLSPIVRICHRGPLVCTRSAVITLQRYSLRSDPETRCVYNAALFAIFSLSLAYRNQCQRDSAATKYNVR